MCIVGFLVCLANYLKRKYFQSISKTEVLTGYIEIYRRNNQTTEKAKLYLN